MIDCVCVDLFMGGFNYDMKVFVDIKLVGMVCEVWKCEVR